MHAHSSAQLTVDDTLGQLATVLLLDVLEVSLVLCKKCTACQRPFVVLQCASLDSPFIIELALR